MYSTLMPELSAFMEDGIVETEGEATSKEEALAELDDTERVIEEAKNTIQERADEIQTVLSEEELTSAKEEMILYKLEKSYNTLSYISKYGLNKHVYLLAGDSINWNIFFNKDIVGLEDFNSSDSNFKIVATEGIGGIFKGIWEFIKKIIESIKNFFKKIWDFFFNRSKSSEAKEKKAEENLNKLKNVDVKKIVDVSLEHQKQQLEQIKKEVEKLEQDINRKAINDKERNRMLAVLDKQYHERLAEKYDKMHFALFNSSVLNLRYISDTLYKLGSISKDMHGLSSSIAGNMILDPKDNFFISNDSRRDMQWVKDSLDKLKKTTDDFDKAQGEMDGGDVTIPFKMNIMFDGNVSKIQLAMKNCREYIKWLQTELENCNKLVTDKEAELKKLEQFIQHNDHIQNGGKGVRQGYGDDHFFNVKHHDAAKETLTHATEVLRLIRQYMQSVSKLLDKVYSWRDKLFAAVNQQTALFDRMQMMHDLKVKEEKRVAGCKKRIEEIIRSQKSKDPLSQLDDPNVKVVDI